MNESKASFMLSKEFKGCFKVAKAAGAIKLFNL
jgi:hypothetical protein